MQRQYYVVCPRMNVNRKRALIYLSFCVRIILLFFYIFFINNTSREFTRNHEKTARYNLITRTFPLTLLARDSKIIYMHMHVSRIPRFEYSISSYTRYYNPTSPIEHITSPAATLTGQMRVRTTFGRF